MDADRLAITGAALLGGTLRDTRRLPGGDLSTVVRITLTDGRVMAVKGGPLPRIEAEMLCAIAAAGAPAPAVLAVGAAALVLSWVEGEDGPSCAWADLGGVVATLHRATGPRYGWPENYAFGRMPIDNRWCDDWPTFWAERRLLPQLSHLPPGLARRVEKLANDLPNRLPYRPRPSLLHGDLWSGNVIARGDRVVALIDPACYYGHGEVDLSMLSLFDAPGAGFDRQYGRLQPGAVARRAIYTLWPALVHLRLFGSAYLKLVETQLARAGG